MDGEWRGKVVKCYCDNMAVVEVLNSGYSRDPLLMHSLRCVFFITEHFRLQLVATHCPGQHNVQVDTLSCNDYQRFIQASSSVDTAVTLIPDKLLRLLVIDQPNWISPHWTRLFAACINQD